MQASKLRKRVVVIGGGFGGIAAAKALGGAPVHITLVDRSNHYLFQPLLYQVAMAGLASNEIATPIRSVLRHVDNARVLLAEVTHVDLAARLVFTRECNALEYDYLVLAPGAVSSYFGHQEWAHVAPGLKDLDDAVEIRRRVLLAFEAAEREPDLAAQRRHLTFVVIAAGRPGSSWLAPSQSWRRSFWRATFEPSSRTRRAWCSSKAVRGCCLGSIPSCPSTRRKACTRWA